MTAQDRAERLRALHGEGRILVLPNAWDALSARLVEDAGAEAIATSSAALAWAHGHADGERLPFDVLLRAVREIVAVVRVPVTVDFEAGYADDPAAVADAIARIAEAGGVGVNLEDRGGPADALVRKIRACKGDRVTSSVFINARTDVFLRGEMPADRALEEAIARGRAFADAGADGFFVPKVTAPAAIEALTRGVSLPLNVLAVPGLPAVSDLRALGVRRLSAGPFLALAAFGAARRAAVDLIERGSYGGLFDSGLTHAGLNALISR